MYKQGRAYRRVRLLLQNQSKLVFIFSASVKCEMPRPGGYFRLRCCLVVVYVGDKISAPAFGPPIQHVGPGVRVCSSWLGVGGCLILAF